jgi:hypothetical protein
VDCEGETDARAVEEIQQVDRLIARRAPMSRRRGCKVSSRRSGARSTSCARTTSTARKEAAAIEQGLRELPTRLARASVKTQAQDLLSWVDFVLQRMRLGFDLTEANRINALAKSTREALASE